MPLICLVRHGQASADIQDYDTLSALGREQAKVVGRELARRGLRDPHLVSGTLVRQRDTALHLADGAGFIQPLRQDPRWNEYDHLALVAGYADPPPEVTTDSRALQDLLDSALRGWIEDRTPRTGDAWSTFAGAATEALTDLSHTLGQGRDAVVVTSGGILAALCGALLSLPPSGVVALNRVAVNASVTTLVVGGSGTSLLSFNDHAHFTGAGRGLLTHR